MAHDIDDAFIKSFEREAHLTFQRQGSKLLQTVRRKTNIGATSTTFQKLGTVSAGRKTRDGKVPVSPQDHTPVECTLVDRYAGQWVDKLDLIKVEHDEFGAIVQSHAWALGREADDDIINLLQAQTWTGRTFDGSTGGMSRKGVLTALEFLGNVPDDGNRFAIVGNRQWSQLMQLAEFAGGDYVGDNYPWLANFETRKWATVMWIRHTGTPVTGDNTNCYIWHKNAIGHASGAEIGSTMQYHNDYGSHFVESDMSMGACMIDLTGAAQIVCDTDAALS